jgi:hypothetical protein
MGKPKKNVRGLLSKKGMVPFGGFLEKEGARQTETPTELSAAFFGIKINLEHHLGKGFVCLP